MSGLALISQSARAKAFSWLGSKPARRVVPQLQSRASRKRGRNRVSCREQASQAFRDVVPRPIACELRTPTRAQGLRQSNPQRPTKPRQRCGTRSGLLVREDAVGSPRRRQTRQVFWRRPVLYGKEFTSVDEVQQLLKLLWQSRIPARHAQGILRNIQ
jgi:hypothetical protein